MFSKTVTVGSKAGLHARPAALVAEAAATFDEEVFLELVGDPTAERTEADSSLMIMALGAEHGEEVLVSSESGEAVAQIAGMIERELDTP
ncbi:Phosphocarrier protein HPr [Corynebacterium occultum]|uniref:Phosphocarrier protein HPr n=1 Tax=Corynebacterium occultum TaxID=2675219 RepID=A0A6B8W9U3_9CORY|nr:HPr family phosphocarrier protein [Corynebacterium occultum]QGU07616.1 Phosphocarrier protein HPr [Corynebacterium occultum]